MTTMAKTGNADTEITALFRVTFVGRGVPEDASPWNYYAAGYIVDSSVPLTDLRGQPVETHKNCTVQMRVPEDGNHTLKEMRTPSFEPVGRVFRLTGVRATGIRHLEIGNFAIPEAA
jgi:hypothetical protein